MRGDHNTSRGLRLVVDSSAAASNSVGVCVAGWLRAWSTSPGAGSDELHVVASASFASAARLGDLPNLVLHSFGAGPRARLAAQHRLIPRLLRDLPADALLATVPQIPLTPGRTPIVVVSYDFRHELLPHEFTAARRALRWVEYRRAYRRADRIATISERTRADLGRLHLQWLAKTVAVHLGGDHLPELAADAAPTSDAVAIAYAHHVNKRPHLVLDAWGSAARRGITLPPLAIIGASPALAAELALRRTDQGLTAEQVRIHSFLSDAEYAALLGKVRVIVLASTFEGFGLPVLEGLRMRRPVVITPEPAMLEIGGPAVTVADDDSPQAIADAVVRAIAADSDSTRTAGAAWASQFTWARAVGGLREQLRAAIDGRR